MQSHYSLKFTSRRNQPRARQQHVDDRRNGTNSWKRGGQQLLEIAIGRHQSYVSSPGLRRQIQHLFAAMISLPAAAVPHESPSVIRPVQKSNDTWTKKQRKSMTSDKPNALPSKKILTKKKEVEACRLNTAEIETPINKNRNCHSKPKNLTDRRGEEEIVP
jgi:hypothetical protein